MRRLRAVHPLSGGVAQRLTNLTPKTARTGKAIRIGVRVSKISCVITGDLPRQEAGGATGLLGAARQPFVRMGAAEPRQLPVTCSRATTCTTGTRRTRRCASSAERRPEALDSLRQPLVGDRQRDAEEALAVGAVGAAGRDHHAGLLEHQLAVGGGGVALRHRRPHVDRALRRVHLARRSP